jgi:hypothetical protein
MADRTKGETERRMFARLPSVYPVTARARGRALGHFMTRDLDLGGLFVSGGGIDLYPNDLVELEFPGARGRGKGRVFRATVIRHAGDGIGLMFHGHDEESLAALRDVMLTAMPAADVCAAVTRGPRFRQP